jgi:hypothetical protein
MIRISQRTRDRKERPEKEVKEINIQKVIGTKEGSGFPSQICRVI